MVDRLVVGYCREQPSFVLAIAGAVCCLSLLLFVVLRGGSVEGDYRYVVMDLRTGEMHQVESLDYEPAKVTVALFSCSDCEDASTWFGYLEGYGPAVLGETLATGQVSAAPAEEGGDVLLRAAWASSSAAQSLKWFEAESGPGWDIADIARRQCGGDDYMICSPN